jgi:hypothetical protein
MDVTISMEDILYKPNLLEQMAVHIHETPTNSREEVRIMLI